MRCVTLLLALMPALPLPPVPPLLLPRARSADAHGLLTFFGSYMAERMVFRAKELLVVRAAMEKAIAKEEVRTELQFCACCCFQ